MSLVDLNTATHAKKDFKERFSIDKVIEWTLLVRDQICYQSHLKPSLKLSLQIASTNLEIVYHMLQVRNLHYYLVRRQLYRWEVGRQDYIKKACPFELKKLSRPNQCNVVEILHTPILHSIWHFCGINLHFHGTMATQLIFLISYLPQQSPHLHHWQLQSNWHHNQC